MSELQIKKATRPLVGEKFGRLTVLLLDSVADSHRFWKCVCDCGGKITKREDQLKRRFPSCGCYRREKQIKRLLKHGQSRTRTYGLWRSMKARCLNPHGKAIKTYGMRGITVCDRWLKFENFIADMGECPEGMELDRINNDKGYSPENCRWATRAEQQRNKTNTVNITHQGRTQCAKDWSTELGIHYATLLHRLKHGWTVEDAFTIQPVYRRAA